MGSRESTWNAGDVLASKYRLVERLGSGGMGEVWSAEHLGLGSTVAVKLLRAATLEGEGGAARFEREARAAAALTSPNVVRVFDHGFERGLPFIVMEKLEGETLAARVRRSGPLDFPSVVRVIGDVARALGKAHDAGIVHRDVKPENVFLTAGDEGETTTKLLDFGVAKVNAEIAARGAAARTRSGALVGTPMYMSPEQLRGRAVDARTDLWSLALVAFECVTGEPAFTGETVAELCAEILSGKLPVPSSVAPVPKGFDAWFRRAASRDRDERFASARELAEGLACLGNGAPAVRSEPAPGEPADDDERSRERASDPGTREGRHAALDSPLGGETARTLPTPLAVRRGGVRPAIFAVALGAVALGAAALMFAGRPPAAAPAAGGAATTAVSTELPRAARAGEPADPGAVAPAAATTVSPAGEATATPADSAARSARKPAPTSSSGVSRPSAPVAGASASASAAHSSAPPNPLAF